VKNIMCDNPALVIRKVKVATWIKRLKDKGYISEELSDLTVDDLETFIMGYPKFDHVIKNDYLNHFLGNMRTERRH